MMLAFTEGAMAQLRKKNRDEKTPSDSTAQKATADTPKPVAVTAVSVSEADSLKKPVATDSLSAQLVLYKGFYTYISDKFFPEKYKRQKI